MLPFALTGPLQLALDQGVDCSRLALCRDERVVVVVEGASGALPGLETARSRGLVQLELTPAELAQLAALDVRVREPFVPHPKQVTSEGVADVFTAGSWHEQGVTGQGVRIAIFDVGFLDYERYLGSELPHEVDTHFTRGWDDIDHGTSVAEVVHDVAPDADLWLVYFWTDVEYLAAIDAIAADGTVDIVNASIGYENIHHTDGTSVYSQAVEDLVDSGVHWVNAAGNEGANTWSGPASQAQDLVFWGPGGRLDVNLRWMDPWGASDTDLGLQVVAFDGTPCGTSDDPQDGDDDPYEHVRCQTEGNRGRASVTYPDGIDPHVILWATDEFQDPVPDTSLVLPADALGAMAIAAVFWEERELAWYSSHGPTDDGREKPDLSAPTYVSVASGEGWFGGTSCAAPHVSGVAALLLQHLGPMEPAELTALLREQVTDMGDPGWDPAFGAGYLQLTELPELPAQDTAVTPGPETPRACACSSGAPMGGLSLAYAVFFFLRRRS